MSANGTDAPGALRAQRRAAGLSQEQLARLAGCSTGYLRLVEAGYRPDPEASPKLRAIVRALGLTEQDLSSSTSNAAVGSGGVTTLAGCGDGHGEAYP